MEKNIRYYGGITDIGGYFYHGYDETDDHSNGISFKFTYSDNGRITMVETQENGMTKNIFASMPAYIKYEYEPDRIMITFQDESGNKTGYAGADLCILEKSKDEDVFLASYYNDEKGRIEDLYGRYESRYKFKNELVVEWMNFDTIKKMKNIKYSEYAQCKYEYDGKNRIDRIFFFDQSGFPAKVKYIDYKGECGSPGPEKYHYFSMQKYIYDTTGKFGRIEYYYKNKKVFP